jgi:hypothetical protein
MFTILFDTFRPTSPGKSGLCRLPGSSVRKIGLFRRIGQALCWLLSTSVQEIGILHAIEHASLPKYVRCEYNQQRPFCSFSLASCLFSRRRGSIRELCVHFDQATNLFQLSRAPRTFFALDQTIDDFPGARNACRHDQRKIRPACGKRPVTAPTDHPLSTGKTPVYLKTDRLLLVVLARMIRTWKQALFLIQPETLLRGPRELFRLFWKHKSKACSSKPRLSCETITLIKEMAANNRLWGAERIRGELLKLDIRVRKRTIQKYMQQIRATSSPWADLENILAQSCSRGVGL